MNLVKDKNPGAYAVSVRCVGKHHKSPQRMVQLAYAYADTDGRAFVDYYCDDCVAAALPGRPESIEE